MLYKDAQLFNDIENVKKISIVPTILEVVCKVTGMGFAAIARVTEERWIACSIRDEIQFGLEPGGELEIKTTICNEIRTSHEAVVINHVDADEAYSRHHTPKIYGFQSYISVPITLKNGDFFGTLCAIDPKPAALDNPATIGMFTLFADLISFHLQGIELMNRSSVAVQDLNRQLKDSKDENRQYQYISNHNLQEPLRKIRLFSGMMINSIDNQEVEKAKELALKVDHNAQKFSMMIKDLSDFSELSYQNVAFEDIDLNDILVDVCKQLEGPILAKNAVVNVGSLPHIKGLPIQMEQLFYHLINNALNFSKEDEKPVINIFTSKVKQNDSQAFTGSITDLVEICVEDNGIGIDKFQLEKIFDIFRKLPFEKVPEGGGIGLAYCRKITRNHGGSIAAKSELRKGTTFCINLPVRKD